MTHNKYEDYARQKDEERVKTPGRRAMARDRYDRYMLRSEIFKLRNEGKNSPAIARALGMIHSEVTRILRDDEERKKRLKKFFNKEDVKKKWGG